MVKVVILIMCHVRMASLLVYHFHLFVCCERRQLFRKGWAWGMSVLIFQRAKYEKWIHINIVVLAYMLSQASLCLLRRKIFFHFTSSARATNYAPMNQKYYDRKKFPFGSTAANSQRDTTYHHTVFYFQTHIWICTYRWRALLTFVAFWHFGQMGTSLPLSPTNSGR